MSKRKSRHTCNHDSEDVGNPSEEAARQRRKSFKTIAKRRRQSLEGRDFSDTTDIIRRYRGGSPA